MRISDWSSDVCSSDLLNDPRYTFDDAQYLMQTYLVAGYKLTPPSPTFLDARDALLAAVRGNDEQDFQSFVAAFAKRGMGAGAVAPDRFSAAPAGVAESRSEERRVGKECVCTGRTRWGRGYT